MRIVVSGAAGFIGSHFCDRLLAEGHTVVALDNFLTGSARNLEHLKNEPRFQFIEQDITRPFSIEGQVDAVANMAALASPKHYLEYPLETLAVGSIGTQHMLQLALNKGARFLLTSTSECCGDPLVHPQAETGLTGNLYQFDREYNSEGEAGGEASFEVSLRLHR